mmetsp:Transcript_96929/g.230492  ORF Transcript_96929/g.230492 Transcript_96929/m.230492 type:complete len:326 (-) Transcript_96929:40-1017(-)
MPFQSFQAAAGFKALAQKALQNLHILLLGRMLGAICHAKGHLLLWEALQEESLHAGVPVLLRRQTLALQAHDLGLQHLLDSGTQKLLVTGEPMPAHLVAQLAAAEVALAHGQTWCLKGVQQEGRRLCPSADHDPNIGREDGAHHLQSAPAASAPAGEVARLSGVLVDANRRQNQQERGPLDVRGDGLHSQTSRLYSARIRFTLQLRNAAVVNPHIRLVKVVLPLFGCDARGAEHHAVQPVVLHPIHLAIPQAVKDSLQREEVLLLGIRVVIAQPLMGHHDHLALAFGIKFLHHSLSQQLFVDHKLVHLHQLGRWYNVHRVPRGEG